MKKSIEKKQTRFHYDFHNAYNERGHLKAELPKFYNLIEAWDGEGHSIEYYVNENGYGIFHYNERTGCYDQSCGTSEYCLPWSANTLRKQLRKELLEARWRDERDARREQKRKSILDRILEEHTLLVSMGDFQYHGQYAEFDGYEKTVEEMKANSIIA